MLIILGLYWTGVPADPLQPDAWISGSSATLALATNLVPFAGIAFLWFIGVLRDRLGELEDQFFATVFFGSGLLFLALLFVAAATIGGVMQVFAAEPDRVRNASTFNFARAFAYNVINVYAIKAAGVFMVTTSTVALYTAIAPRWMAVLGLVLAVILLFGSQYMRWSLAALPLWILLISLHFLIENSHRRNERAALPR
jgi:hypothetical protein